MFSSHVPSGPQQGRANGSLLLALQQCLPWQEETRESWWMDTLHPGTGWDLQGIQKKLGKAESENLWNGPVDLPEMFGKDESNQRDRWRGGDKKDS